MIATISADIVRSTSLQTEDLIILRNRLRGLLDEFEKDYPGFWARIVRGDSIECVVPEYHYALRIAILIKLFVKIQAGEFDCHELLQRHGIRFSIGIADISYADKTEDMINGPAIYLSGRLSIYQSAVNMRSTSAQWGLLNTAIKDFEELDFKRICG